MSLQRLVLWVALLSVFAMSARVSMDTDTWWHLRAGQWIVEHCAVPQQDEFSYTRYGMTWQYPGWLVEVPMVLIYRFLGPGGLNLWTALMVTLAFALVWSTLSGSAFLRAFVLILAATTSGVYWAARPYLVTFVLTAAFLFILEDYRWQRTTGAERRLFWLPVLMVIWANSHGGFTVGFILWVVYWLADGFRWITTPSPHPFLHQPHSLLSKPGVRLTIVGVLMILAVCVNPSGPRMLTYAFKTVSIGALQTYIQEWQSPNFHTLQAQPFIWLLLLTIGAIGFSKRHLAFSDFLLLSVFTYMSLLAWRNVALFALVAPPVLTRHAAPLLQSIGRKFPWLGSKPAPISRRQAYLNVGLLAVVLFAALVRAGLDFPRQVNEEAFMKTLPVQAVKFIRENHPPGRLFNSYNWGGYLIWELPEYPVFVDGRTDLYTDEILDQYIQVFWGQEDWEDVLDRWGIRLILIEPSAVLVGQLAEHGWQLLYQDAVAVVYAK